MFCYKVSKRVGLHVWHGTAKKGAILFAVQLSLGCARDDIYGKEREQYNTKCLQYNMTFKTKEKRDYRNFQLGILMFLFSGVFPSYRIKISKELLVWMMFICSTALIQMMPSVIPNPLKQPTKPTKNSKIWTSRVAFCQHPRDCDIMKCPGKSRFDRSPK